MTAIDCEQPMANAASEHSIARSVSGESLRNMDRSEKKNNKKSKNK